MAKTLNSLDSKELWEEIVIIWIFTLKLKFMIEINLKNGITFLVADYSYKNTELDDKFNRLCSKYIFRLFE